MLLGKLYSNTNSLPITYVFNNDLSTTGTTQSLQITPRTGKCIKLGNLTKIVVLELNENMHQECIEKILPLLQSSFTFVFL